MLLQYSQEDWLLVTQHFLFQWNYLLFFQADCSSSTDIKGHPDQRGSMGENVSKNSQKRIMIVECLVWYI